ncbi:nuclear transcription factor y subunit b-9 [Phtheirospermum japonicum]|uniref:Nuclear transcription factor y subunit b-9 n=1 Tax=Phtheirospermum japonicum TaxID=374723 RepID=A0A830D7U1_9LAMI|nr:nuclear transcription factor y subunit b-9 [Phtheirospermum japonicum]
MRRSRTMPRRRSKSASPNSLALSTTAANERCHGSTARRSPRTTSSRPWARSALTTMSSPSPSS